MSSAKLSRGRWVNSSPTGQNGRQFGRKENAIENVVCQIGDPFVQGEMSWLVPLKENVWIFIKISLKFVPKGPIDNKPALVEVMAWHSTGNKPLPEPMLTQFIDTYMQH